MSRGFVLAALLGLAASVQEPDGTHERRLTRNAFDDTHPAWSPDSKTIVFFSHPYYLPTGNQIVFQSPRDHADEHDVDLYVMDANGRGQRRLLARSGFNGVPVPSRNGKRIAFQRGIWNEAIKKFHWELYVVDADGRNERQLTDNSWSSQVASWFPGDREVAFFANPDGREQLFVLDTTSGSVRSLSSSNGKDLAPSVSPDGKFVAFTSDRAGVSQDGKRLLFSAAVTGAYDVYVIRIDGTHLTRLTHGTEGTDSRHRSTYR